MRLFLASVLCLCAGSVCAAEIRVAVASNFKSALQSVARDYTANTGDRLILSAGATGLLFAQISQGAPYDVFLAADRNRPQALVDAGLAKGPPVPYAVGRLALRFYGPRPPGDPPDLSAVATLSMANPRTAPYGRATAEVLERLDTPADLRIAIAGNVAGVSAALRTGAVDAGFVARATIGPKDIEATWQVPGGWHTPIEQTAVVLQRAQDAAAAQSFLAWLTSPATRAQIRTLGYD